MKPMAEIDDLEGPDSPPRRNGEIVFEAPWQRRVFGITVALCRSQALAWDGFRRQLIRRIAGHAELPYWQNWALALEDVLAQASMVTPCELDGRQHEMLELPAGDEHHRHY